MGEPTMPRAEAWMPPRVQTEGEGLTATSVRGAGWLFLSFLATAFMQLLSAAVMGRLLSPADFGIVALAALVLRAVQYFSQFGIGSAVVQKRQLTKDEIGATMLFSGLIGALGTMIAVLLSPLAGWLLDREDVVGATRLLSLTLAVGGIGIVPLALLRRRLRFKAVAVVEATSYGVGYLLVGIGSAVLLDAGYWSLVFAALSQTLLQTVCALLLSSADLTLARSPRSARGLLSFGGKASAVSLVEFWSLQIDAIGVARGQGAGPLGEYNRATILVYPIAQVAAVVTRVLLSAFARVSGPIRSSAAYWDSLAVLTLVVLTSTGLVAANASLVVGVVLGDQWTGTIQVLPFVALATALQGLSQLPATLCEARAELGAKFRVQLLTLATFVVAVAVCLVSKQGLSAYAASWVLAEVVRHASYLWVVRRRFDLGVARHFALYAEAATLAITGGAASLALANLPVVAHLPAAPRLTLCLLGGSSAVLAGLALWRGVGVRQTVRRRRLIDGHLHRPMARRFARALLG